MSVFIPTPKNGNANPRRNMPRHTLTSWERLNTKNIKSSKGETSKIKGEAHTLNSWSLGRNSAGYN